MDISDARYMLEKYLKDKNRHRERIVITHLNIISCEAFVTYQYRLQEGIFSVSKEIYTESLIINIWELIRYIAMYAIR